MRNIISLWLNIESSIVYVLSVVQEITLRRLLDVYSTKDIPKITKTETLAVAIIAGGVELSTT